MKFLTFLLLVFVISLYSCQNQCIAPRKCHFHSNRVLSKISFDNLDEPRFISSKKNENIIPADTLPFTVLNLKFDTNHLFPVIKSQSFSSNIVDIALNFKGVKYKRGGTTNEGMDCSGLVYSCFSSVGISLPRSSFEIANSVTEIPRNEVKTGDLIFFKTNSEKQRINHVGLVTEINDKEIKFIHSSIKRGVIVSSTGEDYYTRTYAKVGRVEV